MSIFLQGPVFTRWLSGDARNIATTSVANAFFPHTKSCGDAKCAGLERRSVKISREGTGREGTRQAGRLNPLYSFQQRGATGRKRSRQPLDSGTKPCSTVWSIELSEHSARGYALA